MCMITFFIACIHTPTAISVRMHTLNTSTIQNGGNIIRSSDQSTFSIRASKFLQAFWDKVKALFLKPSPTPFIDGNPELGWWDDGVIYRPIIKSPIGLSKEKFPSQKLATHEPYLPFNKTLFFQGGDVSAGRQHLSEKKIILWYIPSRYTPKMRGLEQMRVCPEYPCRVTTNRTYASKSSMLVFNGILIREAPPRRSFLDQVFLFHNQEPPIFFREKTYRQRRWTGIFNWTLSFRSDSDIPTYFGDVRKHPHPPEKDYNKIMSLKSKKVAWMVSHCGSPSKRDKYVRQLKKYIPVDVYGSCGNMKCARDEDLKCTENVANTYKFYLAFENSICPDHITEKFFRFMPYNIIVVARASNQFHRFASPATFINTVDFPSPRELAERLNHLDKNDEEYIKILKRKDQYVYLFEDFPMREKDGSITFVHYQYDSLGFCKACQKLWNLDRNRKIIPNLLTWFDKKSCIAPRDSKLYRQYHSRLPPFIHHGTEWLSRSLKPILFY